MYLHAVDYLVRTLPALRYEMNIGGASITLWGLLAAIFEHNIPLLRFTSVLLAILTSGFLYFIAKRLEMRSPERAVLMVALLPQLFLYGFQINGNALSVFLTAVIILMMLRFCDGSDAPPMLILMAACLSLATINNPFLLSLAAVLPLATMLQPRFNTGTVPWRNKRVGAMALVCGTAVLIWAGFIGWSDVGLTASLDRHSYDQVNPRFLGLYLGHIFIFLSYIGSMFPLVLIAHWQRVPLTLRYFAAVVMVLFLSSLFLPHTGYAYDNYFHTLILRTIDFGITRLGLPRLSMNFAFMGLVGLGALNCTILFGIFRHDSHARWIGLAVAGYLGLMLIDGYISSRLYLPGVLGGVLLIAKSMESRPLLYSAQIAYQISWILIYWVTLLNKYNFGI